MDEWNGWSCEYLEETSRENEEKMLNKNFEVWKNIYEDFYGISLEYTTKKEAVINEK